MLAIAVSFLVETQGGASPHRPHLQSFDTSGKNGLHFSMKSWVTNQGLHEQHKKLFFQMYHFNEYKSHLCRQPCWLGLLQLIISMRRVAFKDLLIWMRNLSSASSWSQDIWSRKNSSLRSRYTFLSLDTKTKTSKVGIFHEWSKRAPRCQRFNSNLQVPFKKMWT